MKAYDQNSLDALQLAAKALNLSANQFPILQTIYDIGMHDGEIKAIKATLDKNERGQHERR